MTDPYFDDEDHRKSERLALSAERSVRSGAWREARQAFADAAALEEATTHRIAHTVPRVRTLFAISAVSLWLKAAEWDEASRAGCAFLATPVALTPDGQRELQALVERAWRSRELEAVFGPEREAFVGLETRLLGGSVRTGIAPAALVAERRDIIVPLLYRVAEWRAQKKFRRGGPSSFASSLEVLEAPARAASFGVMLFLGRRGQQVTDADPTRPKDVIGSFLDLARAASLNQFSTLELFDGSEYVKAFTRAFRDLAGDGTKVATVEFAQVDGARERVSLGSPERIVLTERLAGRDEARALSIDGVLKAVNLRGNEPSILIEPGGRTGHRFRIDKGAHDDTIGPKLNRPVRVVGRHDVSEGGETEDWADDVILMEDGVEPG